MSNVSTESSSTTSSSTLASSVRVNAITLAISKPPPYHLSLEDHAKNVQPSTPTVTVTSPPPPSQPSSQPQPQPQPQNQTESTALPSFLTLLATVLVIFATLILIFSVVALTRLSGQLSDIHLIALYLHVFAYFVVALLSFIGVCTFFPRDKVPKSRRVSYLTSSFAATLLLAIAVSVFCLALLFRHEPPSTGKCAPRFLAQVHDSMLVNLCTRSPLLKVLSVIFLLCAWLVQIALVVLSSLYAQRVSAQEGEKDPYCFDDRRYWD